MFHFYCRIVGLFKVFLNTCCTPTKLTWSDLSRAPWWTTLVHCTVCLQSLRTHPVVRAPRRTAITYGYQHSLEIGNELKILKISICSYDQLSNTHVTYKHCSPLILQWIATHIFKYRLDCILNGLEFQLEFCREILPSHTKEMSRMILTKDNKRIDSIIKEYFMKNYKWIQD